MFNRSRNASPPRRGVRAGVIGVGVAGLSAVGVLMASPALAAGGLPAAPTTINAMVSASGGNDSSCGANTYTGTVYTTVQAAVNAVVAGGVVYVCGGTYVENVTINKAIYLDGVDWNTPLGSHT